MYLPELTLHDATSLEEAAELSVRHAPHVRYLAGGTDLFVDLKTHRIETKHVVSLQRIASLHEMKETPEGLRIGALVTITKLNRSEVIRTKFRPLLDAASRMAAPQIRNVATVGGNIVSAVPCADLPPILTVMNASVVIWSSKRERSLPLESFFVDVRVTKLEPGEVLVAVLVPYQPTLFGAAYSRFSLRDGNAISVAGVAASLQLDKNNVIQRARVVLGAVSPTPVLVTAANERLVGRTPDDSAWEDAAREAVAASSPICDVRGSDDFRREMVAVMTRRAMAQAYDRAKENAS